MARTRKKWKSLVRRAERRTGAYWSKFSGTRYRMPVSVEDGNNVRAPYVDGLVECGRRLAVMLGLAVPPDDSIRDKVREVLQQRGLDEAVRAAVVTRAEGCQALLAHLQTFVCDASGVPEPATTPVDEALTDEVARAWFGRPGA